MKKIELKYLDDEINNLKTHHRYNELTEFGKNKLDSFIEIRKQLTLTDVGSSLPNKALMDSQLSDMISGYKIICKPEANFEKYYSKGFTECWEWLKRIAKQVNYYQRLVYDT